MPTIITREAAVGSLRGIYEARTSRSAADAVDRLLAGPVKDYMIETGETEVYDGEAGIMASLQERQQAGSLDIKAMVQADPELVLALARAGALRADIKAISALPQAADAAPYLAKGETTYVLLVKAEK